MESIFSTLSVIYPVLLGSILIIVLFTVKQESAQEARISIHIGFTNLTIPFVKSLWLIRFTLVVIIIGFFLFPLFRDYSSFFPKNYKLTVSYSNRDIGKVLNEFSKEEIGKYLIDKDWKKKKERIWQSIIQNISNKMSNYDPLYSIQIYKIACKNIK